MNQGFDQEQVQNESDVPSGSADERVPFGGDGQGITPLDLIAMAADGERIAGGTLTPGGVMEQLPAACDYIEASPSPYDTARETIPGEPSAGHPWHDANPMTQELSELAWQQAIAAHQASMQAVDPTAASEPAPSDDDTVAQALGMLIGGDRAESQLILEAILRQAGEPNDQGPATFADSMQQQPGQALDDLAALPFVPAQADMMPPGMPLPEPFPPPPDDPMNLMNPFMMEPGPGF
jgi:hypothetical protein